MVHGTIVAVERKKEGSLVVSGRVGSGWVNVVLYPIGPQPHCFSHRGDYRAVYWALRFPSFEQAMLSLDKLSKNALMQNTTDFYRYFSLFLLKQWSQRV